MRRFGIGTALALVGCIALGAGAFALVAQGGGSTSVTQVADENGERGEVEPAPMPPPGPGFAIPVPPPRGHFGEGMRFRDRMRFRRPSAEDIKDHRAEFAKELGAELGKSTDEVLDALRAVFKNHLDEAVENEDLTQKQADRILKCYDTATCGPPGPPGILHRRFER